MEINKKVTIMISIQQNKVPIIVILALLLATAACKKGYTPRPAAVNRQVQFELFTSENLSDENDSIWFTIFIAHRSNQPFWDSALAPMTVREIPNLPNKLVALKTLTGDTGVLRAGFRFDIKNVGHSDFLDTLSANTNLKVIGFNFR